MLSTKALRLKSKREASKIMESAFSEIGCSSSSKKFKDIATLSDCDDVAGKHLLDPTIPIDSDNIPVQCMEEIYWPNNESVKEKIRLWTVKNGLTTTVVNELLQILRECDIKVPKDVRTLKGTPTDSTNKMFAEILRRMSAQQDQIGRLTEEVITLRHEVRQFKIAFSVDSATNLLPPLPINTLAHFKDFDKKLEENEDIVVQLKYILGRVGGGCSNSFVRNTIKKTMTDAVASQLSWRGTNNKPSIQEFKIKRIITDICHSKFPKAEDAAMNKVLQQHLVHASDRMRKTKKD